jgi:hypothetical protein
VLEPEVSQHAAERAADIQPLDVDQLDHVLQRCFRDRAARKRSDTPSVRDPMAPRDEDLVVGRAPQMIEIYKMIGMLAGNRAPVLVRRKGRIVARTRSRAGGFFRVRLPARPGRYAVVAHRRVLNGGHDVCRRARFVVRVRR